MRLKLRRIGNSRGVILPRWVVWRLHPGGIDADGTTLIGEDAADNVVETGQVEELELTLIGEVAVLTGEEPDELELQAALAYAAVKWRRRQLLRELAEAEAEQPVVLQAARRRESLRRRRRR